MKPLAAPAALDQFYLDARSRLLDLAATLDRIGRGQNAGLVDRDPRLARIREALRILGDAEPGRAERVQKLFSLDYDATWERPQPRY